MNYARSLLMLILVATLCPFASAQKGTVTSVGLSAPSSDFSVTGSPVTTSGTLGLNWNVAPTSSNIANAIVKRNNAGGISVGAINAQGEIYIAPPASTPGIFASSDYSQGTIIGYNSNTSSNSANPASGVFGYGPVGIWGLGVCSGVPLTCGTGVFGTSNHGNSIGFGFATDGNAQQERTAGGWVKALVFASGFNAGRVVTCYNSTVAAGAVTAPCGFTFTKVATGDYIVDFGFKVDDRFFSATSTSGATLRVVSDFNGSVSGLPGCGSSLAPNQVEICAYSGSSLVEEKFYLIVF